MTPFWRTVTAKYPALQLTECPHKLWLLEKPFFVHIAHLVTGAMDIDDEFVPPLRATADVDIEAVFPDVDDAGRHVISPDQMQCIDFTLPDELNHDDRVALVVGADAGDDVLSVVGLGRR